jgi:hypothetical protein
MKACVDCKFYIHNGCKAPQNANIHKDLVRGKNILTYNFSCETNRINGWLGSMFWGTCGKHGRWWKPREKVVKTN